MKPDAQVIDEAIAILEQDGAWCQGSYYQYQLNGGKRVGTSTPKVMAAFEEQDLSVIGQCAEGAIRSAAGYPWFNSEYEDHWASIATQAVRIEQKVVQRLAEIRKDVWDDLTEKRQQKLLTYLKESGVNVENPHEYLAQQVLAPLSEPPLSELNDHESMRASDIILAMKQAREELAS